MSCTNTYYGTGGCGRTGAARQAAGLVLLAALAAATLAGCQSAVTYRLRETDAVRVRENGREQPLPPGVVDALNSYLESSNRVKWSDIKARKASEVWLTIVESKTGGKTYRISLLLDASGNLVAIDPMPLAYIIHDLYADDDVEQAKKVMDALGAHYLPEEQPATH